MKRIAIWYRRDGGYQVKMPGVKGVSIWFGRLDQLKAFAAANEVILKEVRK